VCIASGDAEEEYERAQMPDNASRSSQTSPRNPPGRIVDFSGSRSLRRLPNNLPAQLTSFIGRGREISEVKELLAHYRLLTLTGPGGSGKTRLALAVAFEVVGFFDEGVWFVELAPLSDPDLMPQAVAQALDVREEPGRDLTQTLMEHLRSKELFLILDNCEHLLETAAAMADALLRSCPEVHILATSRETLGIEGESVWVVPPLLLPDPGQLPSLEELRRYEAISLFAERAKGVASDFELMERNAAAVARVCHLLDGMPLAIELAAARVRVLSVEQICSRLESSFALLTGGSRTALPRQRTLKATIDWSYELLGERERILLRRLTVFAGGFTLDAAEEVCSGEGIEFEEVLELLTHLVEKSLVMVAEQQGGEARYRLLETIWQYGWEKLDESGEAAPVRGRHAQHYLALAREAERELVGPDQLQWLSRLESEHDNLRVALQRSLRANDQEEHLSLGLAAALWSFWYTHGHLSEGRRWLQSAIAKESAATIPTRAKALNGVGYIALFQGDYEAAKTFLEQSLALYRGLEDKEGIASCLIYLGFVALLGERDLESVPALYEEASGLGEEFEDRRVVANLSLFSGLIAASQGEIKRSMVLHEEALALFRRIGDIQGTGHCLNNLALMAVSLADYDRASALMRENLRMAREADYKLLILYSLLGFGLVAAALGEAARAARLWGAEAAMTEAFGIHITPLARSTTGYERHLVHARSQLDEAAWEAAWSEGQAMTPEEAIDYALQPQPAPQEQPAPSKSSYPAGLSPREAEVLKLVASGLTNAQIARELFISPRTVERHLNSVYRKAGVDSRVAAARFASEHGLS
jgi:predicted ATPase/DNA-binding CsgD family transcriptional regulator